MAIPETVKMSAALIAPVAVIVVAFVEMLEVLVEILLAFVATSPDTSRISAALIAPVAVMFVALVEMLEVLVEIFEVFVEIFDVVVEILEVFVEMILVFVATSPDNSRLTASLVPRVAETVLALYC